MSEYEWCVVCDEATGRAGISDDSLYLNDGSGPYCPKCYVTVAELAALRKVAEEMEFLRKQHNLRIKYDYAGLLPAWALDRIDQTLAQYRELVKEK
jgi:hypothetical protein